MVTTANAIKNTAPPKAPPATRVKAEAKPTSKVAAASKPGKKATSAAGPTTANAVKPANQPQAAKPVKEAKSKLVRNRFTILKAEYGVLGELKQRARKLARPSKRSELLRAGIKALAAMTDSAFLATLKSVPAIKLGRSA